MERIKINLATDEIEMDETKMEEFNAKALEEFQKKTGFTKFFDDMEKEIISGEFAEGEYVTVKVDGKEYTRKVKYSARRYADLYITIKGYVFTYSDFWMEQ